MWGFLVLTCFVIPWTIAQNPRNQRAFDNGHGWDIRLAVPGEPGNDYPTLDAIPRTSFTCSGKDPGYYADVETNCQVFRVCTLGSTYGFQSFICPNGTLFNQAVLVCDWWMKVNCKKSRELFKTNNEKFANSKLEQSQFMTDIKKMITHPMRNPYDDTYSKNNLIVMQEYKPPSNQLYNGATLSNFNRIPNSAYFQTSQAQRHTHHNAIPYSTADVSPAVSTPSTQYYTSNNHNQKQSKLYLLPNRTGNLNNIHNGYILNGQTGKIFQAKDLDIIKFSQNTHSVRPTQVYQRSIQNTQNNKAQEKVKGNAGSTLRYVTANKIFNNSRLSENKQIELGIEFSKQQLNRQINKQKLNPDKTTQEQFLNIGYKGNDTKQNAVSDDMPPAIITKTLAFRRIIKDSASGHPKSRITFKTWIVRPSKNSKLIVEPTPYQYNRPVNFLGKIIADITNNNKRNESLPKTETETVEDPYVYNVPKVQLNNQIITTSEEPSNTELLPSTIQPEIFTGYAIPTPSPTKPALLYLVPTTFKPSSRLYVPPSANDKQISRQYLSPIIENNNLLASASSPKPFLAINENNDHTFFVSKQSHINTDQNNLAFSDILTKEKLDVTVNDIVKDTNNVLETASPELEHLNQKIQSIEYSNKNNFYLESDTNSDEKLTLQPPPPLPKSSRLIVTPSIDLEPPLETVENVQLNINRISNLPYYEQSTRPSNTIERTVSLKITIPEKIANLLFTNHSSTDSENLEILNTGHSNNWFLSNNLDASGTGIPVGKLIWNKASNISNSQDLVFSLLIDSINAAKNYNRIAQQSVATTKLTPTQPQFRNINNEELQRISSDISQLTSSQFSGRNTSSSDYRLTYLGAPSTSNLKPLNTHGQTHYVNSLSQDQREKDPIKTEQDSLRQENNQPTPFRVFENNVDLNINSDRLYSGQLYQLPVPVVSKQIYNSLYPANHKLSNNAKQVKPNEHYANSNSIHDKFINKSNADVKFIKAHSIGQNTFQSSYHSPRIDQGSSANNLIDALELPKHGITAQLHDNILGTLPHPQDENKFIKYKKDQTYYIYSHLSNDDELSTDTQVNDIQNIIGNHLARGAFSQNDKLGRLPAYELIPSLSYKLEDEREKQNFLKVFQINDYGIPKRISSNGKPNLINRQDVIATDVDFTVDHSKSEKLEKPRFLYDGPNSYSAPQKSVGNLTPIQNNVLNYNAKIEKFDTDEDKTYGYPKMSPAKRFLF